MLQRDDFEKIINFKIDWLLPIFKYGKDFYYNEKPVEVGFLHIW